MSGSAGWSRRSPTAKSGPMKATLPMSSLTKTGLQSNSPSHPFKVRVSPETGVRSPGAVNYKGKCEALRARVGADYVQSMRRTASLDTIYLTGHWPRESLYLSNLQVDRSTQTEDWLADPRKALRHQDSTNEDKLEKLIRHRMRKEGSSRERTAAFSLLGGDSHISHKHRMRSSIEGLNQEIERLVLRSTPTLGGLDREERKTVESTPEGHRAPVADLLRETKSKSVNTQTPAFTASSGPPSQDSPSGRPVSNLSDSRPSSELPDVSEDSSPEQEGRGLGTSPRINKFLAREPPDGCERVSTRFTEERRPMLDISEMNYPLKPSMNFQLKPSLGSAFQPLRSTQ